jgi:hypothetical protein
VKGIGRVSFRELPWFIVSCFVWWESDPRGEPDEQPVSRRGIIVALILLLTLVLVSLWIINALRQTDALQDCVMQGRTNCIASIGSEL